MKCTKLEIQLAEIIKRIREETSPSAIKYLNLRASVLIRNEKTSKRVTVTYSNFIRLARRGRMVGLKRS